MKATWPSTVSTTESPSTKISLLSPSALLVPACSHRNVLAAASLQVCLLSLLEKLLLLYCGAVLDIQRLMPSNLRFNSQPDLALQAFHHRQEATRNIFAASLP